MSLQGRSCLFRQHIAKPHITTWLSCKRVSLLNWPVCHPDLSPTWKHLNIGMTQKYDLAEILYPVRMGKAFAFQPKTFGLLSSSNASKVSLVEVMLLLASSSNYQVFLKKNWYVLLFTIKYGFEIIVFSLNYILRSSTNCFGKQGCTSSKYHL